MSVATATITSDGRPIDASVEVESISIAKAVNRIPSADIRIIDGDTALQDFPVSGDTVFDPGREVGIKLRYEGDADHDVFVGTVVRQAIESSGRGSLLNVQLKDPAVVLTGIRRSTIFSDQTDADIVSAIIADAGLQKGYVPATNPEHADVVQYRATDWDFIVSRADVNGLLVVADAGTISLAAIDLAGSPDHRFDLGISPIYDLEVEFDGESQFEGVVSTAWDPAKQEMTRAAKGADPSFASGNRDGTSVAKKIGTGKYELSQPAPMVADELAQWADARLKRNRMALVRGRISLPGQGDLALLDVIELSGLGKRFSGKAIVTGLAHRVSSCGWVTDIEFGLPAAGFCEEPRIVEPGASGLLPPIGGLHIGVVAAFEDDPLGEMRVRVILPGTAPAGGVVWARMSAPDAGKDRGWFFRPEVGDEVVLGFFNQDPRQPVILGSLFSSKSTPDAEMIVDADNLMKGIVTRSGTRLVFSDDDKASVVVRTPAENSIVLDDDAKEIKIADQHGNTVTMSGDGVTIESAKDLILGAAGDVKISADGSVEIAGAKVDVK